MGTQSRNILEVLKERPIISDGSYVFVLEKRGFVKIGPWTPEVVIEHPEAVLQLHREYLNAGADIIQTFTFFASESRLSIAGKDYDTKLINKRACDLAAEIARPGNAFVCGGVSPTGTYTDGKGKAAVQEEFKQQVNIYVDNHCDFLLAEFFPYVEEIEWAMEVLKATNKPVAVTMRIGPLGDWAGVSVEDCAIRMAKAGADIVGINCQFDPDTCLKVIARMKDALDKEGLKPILMVQPLGHMVPEVENTYEGYFALPEFPTALESRLLTRHEARKFAREAYDLGVRYIGGCCGFEPYHIREMSDELKVERGFEAPGAEKCAAFCVNLNDSPSLKDMDSTKKKVGRDYWMNLRPSSGRPENPRLQELQGTLTPKPVVHTNPLNQ
ncbi:betaine--homocysteine S-methyltransferase 1-like [Lineus longissimus]|uniref:betaine--homocysteine S-methyltransferase 1-like n=1 Tax=Lineus longissimus TaxID=88925 RepID=UPI00315D36D0